ncbi:general secretion pathway protein F [Pseudomonas sp. CFII64]|uniref:type II secretion system inner membrane protein GspF n=1 Tax=Pseudomonas sp. CFII64 TaxID=911242 RepID=UPI0003576C24|nr:type II secretion system inner membrane protein GspF [Pseudomonas sp. CFII64]EPJ79894.1 general secretion pathway protein F [Pseudomonas sp. CFII64]
MAMFRYRIVDADGRARQGEMDAEDRQELALQLHRQGALVLHIEPAKGQWIHWRPSRSLTTRALMAFTQQLAILLNAGLPLDRALGILIKQAGARQGPARALLDRVRERVKAGQPLSAALAQEPHQFTPLYLSLVHAGEAGGALEDSLRQLAEYLERGETLRSEIINALIYPAFLVVGVLGSLVLLLAYVVPQFVPIFQDLGVPIPLVTELVLAMGQFFNQYWLLLVALTVMGAMITLRALRDPARRLRWDRRLLNLPITGALLQRVEAARLARTLGTLLQNGVALLGALKIAAEVVSNRAVRAQVELASEQVKGGGSLALALGHDNLLPELALQMIQVGEEAGQLDTMLLKVGQVFDGEARHSIARLLAALVPTLTIVMAVMVAFIMLAIMLPLMSLTSNI